MLRLDDNAIGDAGVGALAAALKPAVQLETLILNDNKIGDAGVVALADALTGDGGLAPLTIRLENNQFGDEGSRALAAAFKTNEKRVRLFVTNNTIGDAAMAEISAVLKGRAPPKREPPQATIEAMNARMKEMGADYEFGSAGEKKVPGKVKAEL